jgi:hypothetical protein
MRRTFENYILEGGQFGHLSNIWDVGNLSTENLIGIINNSVNLNFGKADLKLDSVAMAFTVRDDGKVVGARNKGQSKNFGYTGLDVHAMAAKFKGHALEFAYTWTIRNLQDAIDHLSKAQKKKIFNDGHNWMAVEVLGWGASNIIDYGGVKELTLLGTIEHDIDGNKVGNVNKDHAKILDGMLRQKSAEQQSKFVIKNVSAASFNAIKNGKNLKKFLIGQVKKIMGNAKTIDGFKVKKVTEIIKKEVKDPELINHLVERWVHMNKSFNIRKIYKQWPDHADWIKKMDKSIGNTIKDIMIPLEKVFLRLGAEVVSALNIFKSKDPGKSASKLKKDFIDASKKIAASGEEKLVKKLALELKRLEAAGGVDAIAPEEGITFFINDGKGEKTLVKLTGTFAPVNQVIGLLFNIQAR